MTESLGEWHFYESEKLKIIHYYPACYVYHIITLVTLLMLWKYQNSLPDVYSHFLNIWYFFFDFNGILNKINFKKQEVFFVILLYKCV